MSQTKAFILHLQRASQRRAQVEALRRMLPFDVEVIDALDGASLPQAAVERVYQRQLHRPCFYFSLSRAEIGVFLSHRAAWKKMIDENLDYAVIFEDDAAVDTAAFANTCQFADDTRSCWDYVLAPTPQRRNVAERIAAAAGLELHRPSSPPLRTLAQFVSNRAARRLLAITEQFDRPIDTFLQMSWVTGIEVLIFQPSGVRDVSREIGGSIIQPRHKGLLEKISREISRPLYRAQVRVYHAFASRPDVNNFSGR